MCSRRRGGLRPVRAERRAGGVHARGGQAERRLRVPNSCIVLSCLWDSDCGAGRRCVQNTLTMQTNCCDECVRRRSASTGPLRRASSTTSSSTTRAPSSRRRRGTCPRPSPLDHGRPRRRSPADGAPGFQGCAEPGAECGPCPACNEMSLCFRQIGTRPACAQPRRVRRVVVRVGQGLRGRAAVRRQSRHAADELLRGVPRARAGRPFDVVTTTRRCRRRRGTFQPCSAPGDTCGPCAPSGLMTTCQQEIGTPASLCPQPAPCVEITCSRSSDCCRQRCVNANRPEQLLRGVPQRRGAAPRRPRSRRPRRPRPRPEAQVLL
jgi:hypothetical protein